MSSEGWFVQGYLSEKLWTDPRVTPGYTKWLSRYSLQIDQYWVSEAGLCNNLMVNAGRQADSFHFSTAGRVLHSNLVAGY